MTLLAVYEKAIESGTIKNDPLQRDVLVHMQQVVEQLADSRRSWFRRGRATVKGIYLYGPVGGGKTYLMDLFYHHVPVKHKIRMHFHHFMQQVDAQLRHLQGKKNPLQHIAAQFARQYRLLCLDEFLVHDIADAMILAELLKGLLSHHVVLIATSNTRPDDLYLNGLQRARFLPAIELVKTHCHVMALADNQDYRLGRTPLMQAYLHPLTDANHQVMRQQFKKMALHYTNNQCLSIQNRDIPCERQGERVVWFRFDVICNIPRSQLDYLEIAGCFDIVFISGVQALTNRDTAKAILFKNLIDVMYDKNIRVIISSAVPIEQIFDIDGAQASSFQRTVSRLYEMQSVDYLCRCSSMNRD